MDEEAEVDVRAEWDGCMSRNSVRRKCVVGESRRVPWAREAVDSVRDSIGMARVHGVKRIEPRDDSIGFVTAEAA